jgi:cytochrome oxidase assembly protein ShyY1
VALVLVAAAGGLGWWQLQAWQERRTAEAADLSRSEPIPLADALGPDQPFPTDQVGQPVLLEGSWLPGSTVLVDGREHEGRDGYWVVTPLAIGGPDGSALPVVLGWTGSASADVEPPTGSAELVGWLQPPEGSGVTDPDPTDDVIPEVRTADLVQRVDQDLYGAYAVATDGVGGLQPATLEQLPPVGRFTALRSLLYAIEWWVFGLFAAFIWWRYLQDARAAEGAEPDPVPSDA